MDSETERVNVDVKVCKGADHVLNPSTMRCECGARKYKSVRVYTGQGARSRLRRLKQIAHHQLAGGVTPEALATARHLALIVATEAAVAVCWDLVCEFPSEGCERLYSATLDLHRWLAYAEVAAAPIAAWLPPDTAVA